MDGVDVAWRGSDVGPPARGEEEGRRLWRGERRGEEGRVVVVRGEEEGMARRVAGLWGGNGGGCGGRREERGRRARAEGGREARTHGGGRRTKNYASSFCLTFILFRSRDKMIFHDKGLYV
jgi:hypothetical protein